MSLTVSVIVPTWRRPADLHRCLDTLADQARAADEVLVIHRAEDAETVQVLEQAPAGLALRRVVVEAAGQVAALNRGLEAARGDIIAITDDDAAPRADWLRRIVETFERDPTLTGLGGRDWLHIDGRLATGERRQVGRVQAWGRCIGNHHLGAGAPREVDILKGANMSFRHVHLGGRRFDVGLKGEGAQVCNDMAFCLALRKAGRRLVYDPAVAVDHFPGVRHDVDQRRGFSAEAHATSLSWLIYNDLTGQVNRVLQNLKGQRNLFDRHQPHLFVGDNWLRQVEDSFFVLSRDLERLGAELQQWRDRLPLLDAQG